jgi:hypothetical protein
MLSCWGFCHSGLYKSGDANKGGDCWEARRLSMSLGQGRRRCWRGAGWVMHCD